MGARVEIETHPTVEITNSKRRRTFELPNGLKKKKSGKVAIANQKTKKFIAAITLIANKDRSTVFEIFISASYSQKNQFSY
jgi:hypothetical protein